MVERNAMQEALLQILEAARLEERAKEENKGAAADDNAEQEKKEYTDHEEAENAEISIFEVMDESKTRSLSCKYWTKTLVCLKNKSNLFIVWRHPKQGTL